MIQFVKFLALTVGLAFSGTDAQESNPNTPNEVSDVEQTYRQDAERTIAADTLKKEVKDFSKISQIPLQPSDNHACGMAHAHEVMRNMDPDYDKKLEHFKNVTLPRLQKEGQEERARRSGAQMVINMPIVFHIIHRPNEAIGVGQNLSDQTIIDQLETLNEDLAAVNAGWVDVPPRWANIKGNPQMQFCLAEVDPNGAPTSGIIRHEYSNVPSRDFIRNTIKPETHWDTNDYYNVWILPIPGTTAQGGVLGWAFFPSAHGRNFDGTVQDYRFTGKGGKTLTHEVGHSFGLPHTWGSGGCGNDDGIADTPLQEANTNSIQRMRCNGTTWPTGPSSCGNEHMYINYMDYSPDACALTFTVGQGDAMRGVANGRRVSLIQNTPSVAASCSTGAPTGGGNPGGGGGGPVATIELDAGIQTIFSPSDGEFCSSEDVTPVVLLTNGFGDTPLTSCEIRYKISGTPGSILFNWQGNLAKGETEEVTLQPFTSPDFSFEFTAWTDNPNGGDDENGFNDEKAISLVVPDVFEPNIFEDFEDETDLPTSTMIEVVDPGSTFREWEISTSSAYGVGEVSAVFRNFNDPDGDGKEDILEFPLLNFEDIENPRIAFDLAYYDTNVLNEKDSLLIRVSTDCGETFTTVYKEGGLDLSTVSKQQQTSFTPEANEWKNVVVDLFDFNGVFNFAGAEKVQIEFVNIGYGNNNMYIDNINLSDGCASNVQVISSNLTCPDECDGFINLLLNGFVVAPEITWSNNVNGQTGESLEGLCAGTYSVTVIDNEFDCEFIQDIEITSPQEITLIVNGNNISSPGLENGSVDVQSFGGTSFFTYEWDNDPSTEPFLLGLSPGEYCVTATDQAGCSISDCYTVEGFDCDMEVELVINQPDCGQTMGSAELIVTGANNPSFVWLNGIMPFSSTADAGVIGPGSYIVNVTDNVGEECTETFQFFIYDTNPPAVSADILDESAAGENDGSISLSFNDDEDFTFAWSTGTSTESVLEDIGAGTYMVTLTNIFTGCEYVETFDLVNLNCTIEVMQTINNVSCFGESDGDVTLTGSGGVAQYSFEWPSGPSFPFRNNLAAGIYPVTVFDSGICRTVVDVVVTQPAMLTTILTTTDESNPGAFDGAVSAQISGGTMPYDIEWSNGDTDVQMIDNLGGGLYFITITDANGCSTIKGASVEGKICPEIIAETSGSDVSCFGADDGTLSVTATGGLEPYTFLWEPGGYDQANVSNVPADDYSVTVTDADGCPVTAEFSITQPAEFTVNLDGQNESSLGAMDGSINSVVVGGIGTLNYAWTGPPSFTPSNAPNIALLGPGEYCLTITDETNCVATACFTIAGGADPCEQFTSNSVSLVINTPISCAGAQDGSIAAIVNGGTPPYTYLWSNSDTEEIATNVAAGLISVTVTDNNNCEVSILDFVVEEQEPILIQADVTGLSAPGANDGAINIASITGAVGTTNCTWVGPNNFEDSACTGIMDLEPGVYTLTVVDDNGCEFAETYTVEGEADPCFNIVLEASFDITNETSLGANDGALEAMVAGNASPVVSYEWTDQNGANYSGNPITDLGPGLYTLVVTTEAGCMQSFSVDVAAGNDPCLNFEVVDFITTNNSCAGGTDGTATVVFEGGLAPYTFAWSDLVSDTESIAMLPAGMISVTITDANNCIAEGAVMINEPAVALSISVTGINESTPGANNGFASANLTGGESPYSYLWSGPNGFSSTDMNIEDLEPGEYCVDGTDINGCTLTECVTVNPANDPCVFIDGDVTIIGGVLNCINTELELSYEANFGEGPYTVEWSGVNLLVQTTETILIDEPGLVLISVTDANGCMLQSELFIEQDIEEPQSTLMINNPSSEVSTDGSAFLTNVSPSTTTVSWLDNNGTVLLENELNIDGLASGTYEVMVTNTENGCFTISTFTLVSEMVDCASFSISAELEEITCAGLANGLAQIDVANGTGPFTFDWDPALPDSPIQSSLPPGDYAVTVMDANGCMDDLSFTLENPEELTVSILTTPVSSPGANDGSMTAVVEGGTPEYTYFWTNLAETETINNLSEGIEICVVIMDANDCLADACATLEVSSDDCENFAAELVFTNQISCFEANDGALQVNILNAVEPITYQWSDGLADVQQQTDLGPGVYTVTVTDANDCTYESQLELTEPESELVISLSSTVVSSMGATDGTATVLASGGNEGLEYVYVWDDPNQQTTSTAADLSPGVYCVTVASGICFAEECIEVFDADNPCIDFAASILITDASCFDACDGTGIITVEGGEEPYLFTWSDNVEGLQERADLCGLGSVTVTDANDCSTVVEYLVNVPNELEVVVSSSNASDLTSSDGSTSAAAFGGTAPYTYNWDNLTIGTSINNLLPGEYTVTVTDDNGCTVEASVEVGVGEDECDDFMGILEITNASCFGADDGSAVVSTEGGFGTLLYDWSSSNTLGANETGLVSGDFVVVVTDQNGCELVLQGIIEEPEELIIDIIDLQGTSGADMNDGLVSIAVSGGTGEIIATWSDGLGSDLVQDGLAAGQYTIEIEDENGCTTTEVITILAGTDGGGMDDCEDLTASYAITPVSCFNELDGSIEVFPAGGAEPYDINTSAQSFTGLQAGIITVIIEDANGCIFQDEVMIPTPNPLALNALGTDGNCGLNGSAEVIISGGTPPFNVNWDNGDTGTFINGLETGDYGVIVTDANGCESASTVSVLVEFNPLSFEVNTIDASCDDEEDGRIILDVTNLDDVSGVQFEWSDGVITQNRINLPGGTYTVTVTDEDGCEYILSREILAPDPITATYSIEPGSTNALFDVSINAAGGSGVYTFDWSDESFGFINSGLVIGNYTVTITDANGCSSIIQVVVDGSVAVLNNLDIISEFELSPNPTTGDFFLDVTLTEVSDIQVSVFDILGRQVLHNTYRGINLNERLDLRESAAGTYFVRVHNEKGQSTKKLIKVD
jgi:hypothetical protein